MTRVRVSRTLTPITQPRTRKDPDMSLSGVLTTAAIALAVVVAYDKYGRRVA